MSLRNIVLMVKDAPKTAKFFVEALGLRALHESEGSIELQTKGPPILVMQATGAASLSSGYTPLLNFDVADMDMSIVNALKHGATLDGPIKYPAYGKVAAVRSPDGHMIGLFEPHE
jgi:catechol 2,3-dioxygenase-like lactoylglutathione lyase family enzyme